jgi:hypothetical protein
MCEQGKSRQQRPRSVGLKRGAARLSRLPRRRSQRKVPDPVDDLLDHPGRGGPGVLLSSKGAGRRLPPFLALARDEIRDPTP